MVSTWRTAQIITILLIAATMTTLVNGSSDDTKLQQSFESTSVLKTTQSFRDNCACESEWTCRCCAKLNNDYFNIYQNFCGNWTVLPESWEILAHITLNDATLFSNKFSGNDVPPLCFPLVPTLPLFGCIKVHSLTPHANNKLHACANATLTFLTFNLLNFQLACADFGIDGIQLVDRDHDVEGGVSTTEAGPEISLETSDALQTTSTQTAQPENENFILSKYLNLWKINNI